MGHSPSKQAIPSKTFSPEVEVVESDQPSQYGKVKLVKDLKTGQEMYLKKIVSHDLKSHKTHLVYYFNRLNTPHPNLVNVIGYTSEEKKAFCSEKYTINLYLDSLFNTVQSKLEKHIKSGDFVSEVELQLLAQNMITILSEFQNKGLAHGEIHPTNIFVTEEAYKLCDPTFSAQQNVNGVTKYILLGDKSFLAPELIKQIPTQDHEIKTDKFKADVFSLGVTLLSLASLTNSEDLYNYEKGTIDLRLMETRIKKVESFYSPIFTNLLRDLLTIQEPLRPDFVQLKDKLNIGDVLKAYNAKDPVSSYAKVPLVKIATKLQNVSSPIDFSSQPLAVQEPIRKGETLHKNIPFTESKVFYGSPVKSEVVQYPENWRSSVGTNYASEVKSYEQSYNSSPYKPIYEYSQKNL